MPNTLTDSAILRCIGAIADEFVRRIALTTHPELPPMVDEGTPYRFGFLCRKFHPKKGYTPFLLGETHLVFVADRSEVGDESHIMLITHRLNSGILPAQALAIELGICFLNELPHAIQRRNASLIMLMTPDHITSFTTTPEA
ncbi:hypothetical protein HQ487_04200 [Candidatus Uhrbacteria bacterium]|nr:hypothetical protein [Candidatus Uhrbacteria bacterium]